MNENNLIDTLSLPNSFSFSSNLRFGAACKIHSIHINPTDRSFSRRQVTQQREFSTGRFLVRPRKRRVTFYLYVFGFECIILSAKADQRNHCRPRRQQVFDLFRGSTRIGRRISDITIDFPRCAVLKSSLDIALTCSTANCVQVVIVRAQTDSRTWETKWGHG